MPLLKIETTAGLPEEKQSALLKELSGNVAEILGKPEQYVMVALSPTALLMAGSAEPAAFIDLRSIGGLSRETNRRLTESLCRLLEAALGIPAHRVYIVFSDVHATNWGWNGATFG